MKKTLLKTLTLTTAATAVLASQQLVAAEEVQPTSSSADADTRVSNPATAVTSQEVAAAKASADTAQAAVTSQEETLATASQELTASQAEQTTTATALEEAKKAAAQATTEALVGADKAIVEAEATVETQTQAVVEAENKVTETTQVAEAEKAQADAATEVANQAQAEAEAAATKVEQLKTAESGITAEQAQANVETAEAGVATAEQAVEVAQTEVTKATIADAQLETAIEDAAGTVETAKTEVTSAETVQATAQAKADTTQAAQDKAQADLNAASTDSVTWTVSSNLPADLVVAIQNLRDKGIADVSAREQLTAVVNKYNPTGEVGDADPFKQYWTYSVTGGDQVVDVENMTDDQLRILNQFYVDYYNAMATQVGLKTLTANDKLIEVSKLKAKAYDNQNLSYVAHDNQVIRNASTTVFGTNISTGENLGFKLWGTETISMSQVITTIVDNLINMTMYDGGVDNYGHFNDHLRSSSFGISFYLEESDTMTTYGDTVLRLVTTSYKDDKWFPENNTLVHSADFTYTPASNASLVTALTVAKAANNAAQAELATAIQEVTTAKDKLAKAQIAYNNLVATERQTPAAQEKLTQAQSALTVAQATLATAQDVLANLTASSESKADAIRQAEEAYQVAATKAAQAYAAARVQLDEADKAKDLADQAQVDLVVAQAKLRDAMTSLNTAKARKESLVNAEANLVEAQKAYDEAVAKLTEAKTVYAGEVAKLEELKVSYDTAYAEYIRLLNLYNLQNPQPTPTPQPETKPESKPTDKVPTVPTSQPESTPNIQQPGTLPTVPGVTRKPDGSLTYSRTAWAQEATGTEVQVTSPSLPATNSSTGAETALLGFVALGLGLGLASKRRKQN